MESFGKKIIKLLDNPFFLAEILAVSFSNYTITRKASILDAYLIIPLIMKRSTREVLTHTNASGWLKGLFKNEKIAFLASIEEDVKYYKNKVNKAILIGIESQIILLDKETMTFKNKIDLKKITLDKNSIYKKPAENIGKILSKYELKEILEFLEVKKI